jgi:hypothetical protein
LESQKVIKKELPVVACQMIDLLEAAVSRELQKETPMQRCGLDCLE